MPLSLVMCGGLRHNRGTAETCPGRARQSSSCAHQTDTLFVVIVSAPLTKVVSVSLGELEQIVLFALVRLESDEAHGPAIVQEIEERVGRRVAPGALYTVLERLQTKGFVESWIGDSTPERGGRRRKVYRILPGGAGELRTWYAGIRELADGAAGLLDVIADSAR